jgi:hypothetical protein
MNEQPPALPVNSAPRGPKRARVSRAAAHATGKLRIGDNWNAITIIALSQSNPLKAIAEFVENSIDAHAKNVTIVRGKEHGQPYLRVADDGDGIPRNDEGIPDFRYVATHICDSLKRTLRAKGLQGIQGEFGIGLLSFWTVGERLVLSSAGADGRTYQMEMQRDQPGYTIYQRKTLFGHPGTELLVRPLLPGLRSLSGEKIQNYLAAELRDRIRASGVRIRILDRSAKRQLEVQPRQYTGRLIHEVSILATPSGEVSLELYLNVPSPQNAVSLFRAGTRVVASLVELEELGGEPWTSGYLQGMVDAPFLQLTPGTRSGVIRDAGFDALRDGLETVRPLLLEIIEQEKKAEEEEASRHILKSVQRAFREAFLTLPPEEYQWFDLHSGGRRGSPEAEARQEAGTGRSGNGALPVEATQPKGHPAAEDGLVLKADEGGAAAERGEREFFQFPGPLHSALISPSSAVLRVNAERGFRCIARDKSRRPIEEGVDIRWRITDGAGRLSPESGEIISFTAPSEPGLTVLLAEVRQGEILRTAEAVITISETLLEKAPGSGSGKGLPGYTYLRMPGELWRSRYDEKNNLVVINNGHKDYLFAARKPARKLKYICRLYGKELVLANFPGFESRELLERLIELSLYAEENLR